MRTSVSGLREAMSVGVYLPCPLSEWVTMVTGICFPHG